MVPVCCDLTGGAKYRGGYADVWKGNYQGQDVAVKVIRTYSNSDLPKIVGVSHSPRFQCNDTLTGAVQRFCKEAVMWKFLQHPNVLPLIGVTISKTLLAMTSNWMPNGNINDFVKSYPEVNRLDLVGSQPKIQTSSLH